MLAATRGRRIHGKGWVNGGSGVAEWATLLTMMRARLIRGKARNSKVVAYLAIAPSEDGVPKAKPSVIPMVVAPVVFGG